MKIKFTIFAMIILVGIIGRIDTVTAGNNEEIATLAGGCFWCLEAVFEELQGVSEVESGFAGGRFDASYQEVCSGETGHAEVVQITFDPAVISYAEILAVFFSVHDPTTLNRQGADVGTQYRSAVYYHDDSQKAIAEKAITTLTKEKIWPNPVVTEIAPYDKFFIAEDGHQDYYKNNRNQGYCQVVINPKLAKFRKEFADRLKD
ncbi:MAG: peptide-methionine (S)-S-oxide reductase MsrA [Candidatus Krumholzibacteria bacterium]|nr:peptide-methionine (S)-S-oxide reductase MsrA [Candidatus Krumholzibacteria bacterium]